LMLRLSRDLRPVSGARRLNSMQRWSQSRPLHVFFLRPFNVDPRPLRWIFDSSRRSFEQRVLIDRQRPMENVAVDRTTALQFDADGTDGALDAAADGDVLRNDAALDLCAIADYKIRSAQLAFDPAEDLRWTIAFYVADDRHSGPYARTRRRVVRRLPSRRRLFKDRMLLLHPICRHFGHLCLEVLLFLRCFALEHFHLRCTEPRQVFHSTGVERSSDVRHFIFMRAQPSTSDAEMRRLCIGRPHS